MPRDTADSKTTPPIPNSQSPITNYQLPTPSAPFLVWPVSQREFYRTLCIALAPAMAWGVVLFGMRPLLMLLATTAAMTFTYLLIKRWLKWKRAANLLHMHCLLSVLVLVALAHPTWPVWIMTSVGLLLPIVLSLIGGPGKERIHIAVAAVIIVQYVLLPHLPPGMYAGKPDAILARDRLVMGDIRDQAHAPATLDQWPHSRNLAGNDALPFAPPAITAAHALDQISDLLPAIGQMPPSTSPDTSSEALAKSQRDAIQAVLDRALVKRLPDIESFLWGVAPNRIGAASLIALILAGLYLSYRYILRPRSVLFYLLIYILATAVSVFTPATWLHAGPLTLWSLFRYFPGQIVTLFNFLLLNSDAAFAGVIILALPGTEPLTDRGRRIFLALAASAAAALHRLDPATPAATMVLCILMPAAPLFDRLFTQRSWLNGR